VVNGWVERIASDARFIITNLNGRAKHLYEKVYCQRGTASSLVGSFVALRSQRTVEVRMPRPGLA
jgi:hypothetical protein